VLLIDDGGPIASGKALDIQQAGAVEGFQTRLEGTRDFTRVTGCAVCVVADTARPPVEWRGEEALALMKRLNGFLGEAPVVYAGASQSDLLLASVREAGFDRQRAIGSAPEALAAATKAIVALEAHCSSSEVSLSVLGTPPSGFVIPWGEAAIGGHALERVLTQVQIRRVEARVTRLWPPGPHALGLAAARVVEALVTSARRAPGVLAVLDGEFGVRNRVGVLPCLLAPGGIARVRVPFLSPRERVQLETALGG
jgi:malate dehydrogenase